VSTSHTPILQKFVPKYCM